jgi:hypothetical protein
MVKVRTDELHQISDTDYFVVNAQVLGLFLGGGLLVAMAGA